MKTLVLLACTALTCACSPAASDGKPPTAAIEAATVTPVPATPDTESPAPLAPAVLPVLRFGIAEGGAVPALKIEGTDPSPCGPVARVRTNRIPLDDPALIPHRVVEFAADGRVVRTWGTSYEADVVGLDGQRLRFHADTGTFWTTPSGDVEAADVRLAARDASASARFTNAQTVIDCPVLAAFKGSGTVHCHRVRDDTGAERRIAMEGVCS